LRAGWMRIAESPPIDGICFLITEIWVRRLYIKGRGVFALNPRHSRAGGNPERGWLNALDPRLRGGDGKNTPRAHISNTRLQLKGIGRKL
jgi:hypothetical protein